ncbi:MAG: hypothetical protein H6732_14220 [Alphaproteobacteria bacterium]|nr:hypothetical protein [Alphaproteobacteria bacterium]
MPGLRTRSTFLDGVGDDARHVVAHATLHLDLAASRRLGESPPTPLPPATS